MKPHNKIYKLILTLSLILVCPLSSFGEDNIWGDKGADYTMEDASSSPANTSEKPAVARTNSNGKYIKSIEVHGTNVINPDTVLTQIKLKKGDLYDRKVVQEDLKNIYNLGFFSEKMRAIPVNNPDGTITLKIILEENAPVTDFTIEGNTVVPTEEILAF